jgi:hypothetical protein
MSRSAALRQTFQETTAQYIQLNIAPRQPTALTSRGDFRQGSAEF